ncbi:hypothetical protein ABIE26_003988 [Pedobacter africanus]|uniref:Uncharacterized protein n=1 Tax=Pedobacter africanus TaxID=151894 RepID=A0ACC6L118_9SPHI|nr:hypothetical protein [Pedobacter africanus]MDR6785289.1 hypothetical protein [Pedobacter africanus]
MNENINEKGDIGEKLVNKLAFDTYLKFWCYPGPKDEKGSKKEICDLLILFRDTAIILSVKNYAFKGNYERYFRSTLDKAVAQISGAERKLFDGGQVYINHIDLGEALFEPMKYSVIHRVIVNHSTSPLFYPGGRMTGNGKYVHVFNWEAFLGAVNELDTIPDFIAYLSEREVIFLDRDVTLMTGDQQDWTPEVRQSFIDYNSKREIVGNRCLLISGNELDLLADYYWNVRKFNKVFYLNDYNGGGIDIDGKWNRYLEQKEVQNKKMADTDSYFIDEFVKHEVLYSTKPSNLELAVELLSLSRFERRILGSQLLGFAKQYKNASGLFTARRYGKVKDLLVTMVLYVDGMSHNGVMELIRIAAEGYVFMNNYRDRKVVVIGFSNKLDGFRFGLLKDIEPFGQDYEQGLVSDLKMLNWFTDVEVFKVTHEEYPEN